MRLETDNADTMPVTDAVYGKHRRRPDITEQEPRGHMTPLWRSLSLGTLDQLARRYGKETRRFAARRRKEGA